MSAIFWTLDKCKDTKKINHLGSNFQMLQIICIKKYIFKRNFAKKNYYAFNMLITSNIQRSKSVNQFFSLFLSLPTNFVHSLYYI
jgi:hypothetical protein